LSLTEHNKIKLADLVAKVPRDQKTEKTIKLLRRLSQRIRQQ